MTAPTPAPATPKPKRVWPLFVLAALGFVPGFGVLFGAAALTWGLLSERPHAKLGAILGGSGALLNLVGALLLGALFQHTPEMDRARVMIARRELGALVVELEHYHDQHGRYPATLQILVGAPIPHVFINTMDHSDGVFRMQFYQYRVAPDSESYDLFGVGPDGIAGTADDVRPELPDSLRRHSGYRPAR
jgi:hypothetical protein